MRETHSDDVCSRSSKMSFRLDTTLAFTFAENKEHRAKSMIPRVPPIKKAGADSSQH